MEAEKQIMRQQTILNTPGKTVSGHPPTVTVKVYCFSYTLVYALVCYLLSTYA